MLRPIQKARLIAGMTQTDVAHAIGVTPMAVSMWESGRTFPKASRLKKIAEVLNVPVAYLLEEPEGR